MLYVRADICQTGVIQSFWGDYFEPGINPHLMLLLVFAVGQFSVRLAPNKPPNKHSTFLYKEVTCQPVQQCDSLFVFYRVFFGDMKLRM